MDILEGHYFSKMNRMLFVRRKKIEVISEWAGQTETQEVKEREKTDGDEGESGGLRRRLMMEKESRHSRLEKKVHRDGVLFT